MMIRRKYIFFVLFISFISLTHANSCYDILSENNVIIGRHGIYFAKDSFARAEDYLTSKQSKFDLVIQLLQKIDTQLEKQGVKLIIAPIPPKPIVLNRYIDPISKKQLNFNFHDVEQQYMDFIRRANNHQVSTVDLLTPLQNYDWSNSFEIPNLATERHWSVKGSQLSAQAIAETIKDTQAYQNLTLEKEIKLQKTRYFNLIAFKGYIGKKVKEYCGVELRSERLPKYEIFIETKTSSDLFSPTEVEILLVGTSYSGDAFSFSQFLAYYTQLEIASLFKGAGGMFSSFLNILSDEQLSQQKPKFLIWEFPFLDLSGNQEGITGTHDEIISHLKNISSRLAAICEDQYPIEIPINPENSNVSFYLNDLMIGENKKIKYTRFSLNPIITNFQVKSDGVPAFIMNRNTQLPYDGQFFFELGNDISLSKETQIIINSVFFTEEVLQISFC